MRILLLSIVLCGCASPGADCIRMRYRQYNVLACDDSAVGEWCRKHGKLADDGTPLDYYPRACMDGRSVRIACHNDKAGCCWDPVAHVIWVAWNNWQCMVEELCHREWWDAEHRGPCKRERMP